MWSFMPTHQFYPPYLADPRRPQLQYVFIFEGNPDIPKTGGRRSLDSAGIERSLIRWRKGDYAVEFVGNAGITAQFDFNHSLDGLGFDGWYGGGLYATQGNWGSRFVFNHQSAHIADEYIQRVGRDRQMYTREEVVWGVSWWGISCWRFFAEAGYGFTLNSELQSPWRLQWGLEYIGEPRFFWGSSAWYVAGSFRHMEERDWELASSLQTGFLFLSTGSQRIRAGIQVYDGQSNLGEFSNHDESYFAFGFWMDM